MLPASQPDGDAAEALQASTVADPATTARSSRKVASFVEQFPISDIQPVWTTLTELGRAYTDLLDQAGRPSSSALHSQTPSGIAKLMATQLHAQPEIRILDPACGAARLLVEVAREQIEQHRDPNGLKYVGQEVDPNLAFLGALHLMLHGVVDFEIRVEDSLLQSTVKARDFDRVVGDPPVALAIPHLGSELQGDVRWAFGGTSLPKTADWLFLQHGLVALKPGGRAVFITAHGPMFRSGAEAAIRRDLLAAGWVSAVVALPSALYPNLALPLVMTVFDRPEGGARGHQDVLMIDASGLGTREGRVKVLPEKVRQQLTTLIQERNPSEPYATLVESERIFENKEAWQPNQYLDFETDQTRDLTVIEAELQQQLEHLKAVEGDLQQAFGALPHGPLG
ncbi:HsdM family class I SAM-dependent methyltransferase [Deinococcus alpinitundrae]|uniref:HsdM family class I SAM-dependent methyltransferase n=1 Tax=Deinococcus alpinitundrae TaxID=468913 RepID=UPI001379671F|nr:N-6 DNA methylase [Deinococcus alpinitundrae]